MFDQYVKLFNLSWLEPWMVEAVVIVSGALLLSVILCKVANCMNGDK